VASSTEKVNEHEDLTPARCREILDELKAHIAQAQSGDEEALSRVRELLKEAPRFARIFSDLAKTAEHAILERVSGGDILVEAALPVQLESMRKELAGPDPSPLEKLLAERICACWLQLQYAEIIYAQNLGKMNLAQCEHYQRRLDRLHRRYLSSIKTLAQIRKLGPAVQINIAEKQINTAK
jgi:hypothetical protein